MIVGLRRACSAARIRRELALQAHLRRLYEGLQALDIKLELAPSQVMALVRRCVDSNGMRSASGAHVHLIVSRGLKRTPSHHPAATVGAATLAIIPEWIDTTLEAKECVRTPFNHLLRGCVVDALLESSHIVLHLSGPVNVEFGHFDILCLLLPPFLS